MKTFVLQLRKRKQSSVASLVFIRDFKEVNIKYTYFITKVVGTPHVFSVRDWLILSTESIENRREKSI